MKKTLSIFLIFILLGSLLCGCGKAPAEPEPVPTPEPTPVPKDTVYFLLPNTSENTAIADAAESKCEEIIAAGSYKALCEAYEAGGLADLCGRITGAENAAGAVIVSGSEDMTAAGEALYTAGIPFTVWGQNSSAHTLATLSVDEEQSGAAMAYRMRYNDLQPKFAFIWVGSGDSTLDAQRRGGMEKYLLGQLSFQDAFSGKSYENEILTNKPVSDVEWLEENFSPLFDTYTVNYDGTPESITNYFTEWLPAYYGTASTYYSRLYICCGCDEAAVEVLNYFKNDLISPYSDVLSTTIRCYLGSFGGSRRFLDIMEGIDPLTPLADDYFTDIFTVYDSPLRFTEAADLLLAYLGGETPMDSDVKLPVGIIDRYNAAYYKGY